MFYAYTRYPRYKSFYYTPPELASHGYWILRVLEGRDFLHNVVNLPLGCELIVFYLNSLLWQNQPTPMI